MKQGVWCTPFKFLEGRPSSPANGGTPWFSVLGYGKREARRPGASARGPVSQRPRPGKKWWHSSSRLSARRALARTIIPGHGRVRARSRVAVMIESCTSLVGEPGCGQHWHEECKRDRDPVVTGTKNASVTVTRAAVPVRAHSTPGTQYRAPSVSDGTLHP